MPNSQKKPLELNLSKTSDRRESSYPAPQPTGYQQADIEKIAGLIAKAVGFSPGDDLSPIVERLGGRLEHLDTEEYFFKGGTARITVDGPGKFVIYLHKFGGLFQNRFAIAHELGHYFLHSRMGEEKIMATHEEKAVSLEEWEASVFAAAMLMPRKEMKRLKDLSNFDLSAVFSVSLDAVANWKQMLKA